MTPAIDAAKVKAHLDAQIAQGYKPFLVTFPGQDRQDPECRACLDRSGPFYIVFFGRQLHEAKVYIYCSAMLCESCSGDRERTREFLDRVEIRYNWLKAHERN